MKEIEKIFDIEPQHVQVADPEKVQPPKTEEPENTDYDFVRQNYYDLIQQGSMAMNQALRVAAESDHPRALEVLSGLMKNLADVNRQLLMIGEDKEKVKSARKGNTGGTSQPQQITNNNTVAFVGTTSDLNKLIKDQLNTQ
jgi:hypothetical protein